MYTISVKHSLINDQSIRDMMEDYDIGEITACHFLTKGLNDSYFVESNSGTYIFRVYRKNWRSKSDILFELEGILHLQMKGIAVSVPVMRKDSEFLTWIDAPEGLRYGVLFTYSEGDRPDITASNCRLIGEGLAKIHSAWDDFQPNHDRLFQLDQNHLAMEPFERIQAAFRQFGLNAEEKFLKDTVAAILKELNGRDLEYGFCHGDFHNFNMHVKENRLEAFDFDCGALGYRSYDLAVFSWNLLNNYPSMEKEGWAAFLEGYQSSRKLNEADVQIIGRFVSLRRIWFMGILLENDDVWGTVWKNEKNLSSIIGQLKDDIANRW
ncbi:phosphotransferase [Falsibacillus pallidus]|uniref:Ser/Thr protein kinase RdoA (MazF antagonist) n=1 Tax=Falsibacillus pallidus TaxID=493781 RepID=A0A370GP41_9BACI|nr:phosphotransferase [Falsibacillus pallidus]RDI45505.1 Ser/Thr protein kinase RdoA (MazF antagonist) [Falsibacillus pallidus]